MKSLSPFVIIPVKLVDDVIRSKNLDKFPFDAIKNKIAFSDNESHFVFNCDLNYSAIHESQISEYHPDRTIKLDGFDFNKVVNFFSNKIIPNVKYKMIVVDNKQIAETVMNLIEQYHPDEAKYIDLYSKPVVLFSEYNVATAKSLDEISNGSVLYSNINFKDIRNEVGDLCDNGERKYKFYCLGDFDAVVEVHITRGMNNAYTIYITSTEREFRINNEIVRPNQLTVVDNRGNVSYLDFNVVRVLGGSRQCRLVSAGNWGCHEIVHKLPKEFEGYV